MKNNFFMYTPTVLCIIMLILSFINWFAMPEINAGDWPYYFREEISDTTIFPPSWSTVHGGGLGGVLPAYNLDIYLYITQYVFVKFVGLSWPIVYKIFWYGLFIFLSVINTYFLLNYLFKKIGLFENLLGIMVFTTNTYILMIVGGGQMGVALSYALIPLGIRQMLVGFDELLLQYKIFDKKSCINTLFIGLSFGLQALFDPRIAYITFIAGLLYGLGKLLFIKNKKIFLIKGILFCLGLPSILIVLLHMYWLLPLLVYKLNPIPPGILSVEGFKFFSFTDFSHAISLLHPNWPENIFGKVYFMKAEFLLIPIIAFSGLLFTNTFKKSLGYFALLALIAAFLAKGANEPFGKINVWIFENIPLMNTFRDSTKFYMLIALSYSILLSYSVHTIFKKFYEYKILQITISFLIIITWGIFLYPVISQQLTGTFQYHPVPQEYKDLTIQLNNQKEFFRTLWIPKQQRFTFASDNHPPIEARELFQSTNSAQLIKTLKDPSNQQYLAELSIKYVIIPYDSIGEILLDDRKYSSQERSYLEKELDSIRWLKKIKTGNLTVYETPFHKDHFWLNDKGNISYTKVASYHYVVKITNSSASHLFFSENYSPHWQATINSHHALPSLTKSGIQSYKLPREKDIEVTLFYAPEKSYQIGRIISGISIMGIIFALFMLKSKGYEK